MQLCRFNGDRLGLIERGRVYDVTAAVASIAVGWPLPFGDPLIAQLDQLLPQLRAARQQAASFDSAELELFSPVPWPSKIMAAPANYRAHVEIDGKDPGVDQGVHNKAIEGVARPVDQLGLFLKASSSIVGPGQGIVVDWGDRRVDHEVELVVVIGKTGRNIPRARAFDYIAGYTLGLDISVRGAEDRSFRKSADSFAVIGPALVTTDEVPDPENLTIWLDVNGEVRQRSSTGAMTVGIAELIEIASKVYALYPGDILMTGTPSGVGPIRPGDVLRAGGDGLGEMTVHVRGR